MTHIRRVGTAHRNRRVGTAHHGQSRNWWAMPTLLFGILLSPCIAAEKIPTFRAHEINPSSEFPAAAAIDVNGDGQLDIVSGGFWYEAPTWKRQFLRDVPQIRGRYDDYSNLPLDVNGDGYTDLISANYRSESIFWIEHPGKSGEPWKTHLAEKPGAMETARLADVNGDGRLDLLPNLMKSAAWWEIVPPNKAGEQPRWVRHDLPQQAAGHGIGFGDINGDGRGDIVAQKGWLEASKSRADGTWKWHPDFQLHGDASIPVLVADPDGDGDSDLIWGRGHQYGLYWLEQVREGEKRRWVQHEIDTSWAQPHAPLLADVDNDGREELVVGKRYFGHEGRDPGEKDPLAIYWYKFDREARKWQRHTISEGGKAGWDLDPKAVDIDADGDIDLIAPARSGLYLFENLLVTPGGE